jgi:quinoprotein relay system zinc metallohydrolase 2
MALRSATMVGVDHGRRPADPAVVTCREKAMFEAILTLCLAASPETCRDRLLPGYAHPSGAACRAALRDDPPETGAIPDHLIASGPTCRAAAAALDMVEVAPGVFAHEGRIAEADAQNRGDVSNPAFVIGETSVAVIDTGTAPWIGEALWRAIRARTDLPVGHVILTHMHPDHVFGAGVFERLGARIWGHAELPRALADRQAGYLESLRAEIGNAAFVDVSIPRLTDTVGDRAGIDLGGRMLALRAWPVAHTGNDLTVTDRATRTLFAGDLVFDRHAPALDGSLRGWRAVLADLQGMEVARVVPGHGDASLPWPEGAEPLARYLEVLERDTRAALDAGARLSDAVRSVARDESAQWQLFEVYNPRNVTVAFTELEWE